MGNLDNQNLVAKCCKMRKIHSLATFPNFLIIAWHAEIITVLYNNFSVRHIIKKFAKFVRLHLPHLRTFSHQILKFYYFYWFLRGILFLLTRSKILINIMQIVYSLKHLWEFLKKINSRIINTGILWLILKIRFLLEWDNHMHYSISCKYLTNHAQHITMQYDVAALITEQRVWNESMTTWAI